MTLCAFINNHKGSGALMQSQQTVFFTGPQMHPENSRTVGLCTNLHPALKEAKHNWLTHSAVYLRTPMCVCCVENQPQVTCSHCTCVLKSSPQFTCPCLTTQTFVQPSRSNTMIHTGKARSQCLQRMQTPLEMMWKWNSCN